MLLGTRGRGVRTLGLAATDLRRPLGARKPFVAPADFRGAKLRVPAGSRVSSSMLEALGATPVQIASGVGLEDALKGGTVDGAESSFGYILLNAYYKVATAVTANLVLSAGRRDQHQRAGLPGTLAARSHDSRRGRVPDDEALVRGSRCPRPGAAAPPVCRGAEGCELDEHRAVRASPGSPARLRDVEGGSRHGTPLAQIQKLKKGTRPAAPLQVPAGCAA
jgi:hypothetical protein